MTESARENVNKISEKLNIKTIIIDEDSKNNSRIFKRIFLAWAKKPSIGMIQMFCVGCRSGILKYQLPLMKKYNIDYLADGGSLNEDTYHKLSFLGIKNTNDDVFIRTRDATTPGESSKVKMFGLLFAVLKETLMNPYFLNPLILVDGFNEFKIISSKFSRNKSFFKPLSYEKYDEDTIINIISKELNWEKPSFYSATWRSDCEIAILKNYCYSKMVGFSDYDVMLSSMIREGLIDRKVAISRIDEFNNFDIPFIDGFLQSKGIDPLILHNTIKLWQEKFKNF